MKKRTILKILIILIPFVFFAFILCITCIPMIEENEKLMSKTYNIGDTMICNRDDYEVTITNLKTLNSSQNNYISNGTELVAIYLKVKNVGSNDFKFRESNLKLINSNGEIIKPLIGSIREMWDGQRLNNITLSPSGEKEGYIVFLNNNLDNSNLSATYNCNTEMKYNIKLQ